MTILAIDPGNKLSAYLLFEENGEQILGKGKIPNLELRALLGSFAKAKSYGLLAIENIQSFGMPVGREIFETCVWTGRFVERSAAPLVWPVYRTAVKGHFCPDVPNDKGIRAAMCRRHDGDATKSKQQGKLAGVVADIWSALAIATYVADMRKAGKEAPRDETFLLRASGFSKN